MKRTSLLLLLLAPFLLHAQPKLKNKKYQGLLWEISGHGLKKSSYLFGTMHVSSKMAFHLADSFYLCIHNADMVALETNPESWQEDMSKYDLGNDDDNFRYPVRGYMSEPADYFTISTLKFYKYDKKIERALYSNPSTINSLLYRSNGNRSSDFEEDTYLDMYIYQCGKKWGKKVAGVEKYGESMRLMAEAYKDAAKDKNKKERSFENEDNYSSAKLQEAYRSGNLDWLDSINKYNSFSSAFDEKFLYRRNEIQASSIDSILRSGQSLFVGVGAAHLPGNRGVIEILRGLGYKLRPVKMGASDSQHKNEVEKIRVPVTFTTQFAEDGFYKVDIPGKFYKFGDDGSLEQKQYADMANGSYYMVTRIMTNAWMWGQTTARVNKVIDSLLYENIPGKIIQRSNITKNGYPGIELTNKTRRGDIQRYNIFITPFEVILFKMSGTGDYVNNGDESKRFFGSIQLKEYKPDGLATAKNVWKKFTPPMGGFTVDMPHEPYTGNDGSWIYDAEDKSTQTQYRVIRTDIHNYHFTEEDTFDLSLMQESFGASDFIDKLVDRKFTNANGYPALDCRYKDKYGGLYLTRFIIQGPHYYSLVAHGKQDLPALENFIHSFTIIPFVYPQAKQRTDTALYFTVLSPVFPQAEKEKLDIPNMYGNNFDEEEEGSEEIQLQNGVFRSKTITNDTTGEKIFVAFFKSPPYAYLEDSTILDRENQSSFFGDSSWIFRKKTKYELPNKTRVWETIVSDTGSSRTLWAKTFYKDGIGFSLLTESDTLSQPSSFLKSFYESFDPVDTLEGNDLFSKKSKPFFDDLFSGDSLRYKKAIKGVNTIEVDSTDLLSLQKAIASISWKEKKYLWVKKTLIGKLDNIKTMAATDYLKKLYYQAGDTLELQHTALEVMLQQQTMYAYTTFRDIIVEEPPVLKISAGDWGTYDSYRYSGDYDNGNFIDELKDSLQLTRTILPDLLSLLALDDYKYPMMNILASLVDSGLVTGKDYDMYFTKFYLEAKQEMKKQVIAERQKAIKKAQENKLDDKEDISYLNDKGKDEGNDKLNLYATLLLPYWDSKPNVPVLLQQLLTSDDKELKYNIALLLMKHKKSIPDTLLDYFARNDDYRYQLYTDLKAMDKLSSYQSLFSDLKGLAKSKLLGENNRTNPDSLVYLDKLTATIKGKKGWVYFFKYKTRKDDASWKIAATGLVTDNIPRFELAENQQGDEGERYRRSGREDSFDLTGFGNTKIKEDEPIKDQLNEELKRLLYGKRKSGKVFYDRDSVNDDQEIVVDEVSN